MQGGYSRQTNSMGDQYTKASLRGAACEKKTQGYQTHLLDLELDPEPGVPFSFRFVGCDLLGITMCMYCCEDERIYALKPSLDIRT